MASRRRPFCLFPQQPAAGLLFTSSGSASNSRGQYASFMEPPASLCLASFALSRPVINRIRQTIAAGFTLIASFWPQKSRSSQTTLFSSFSSRSPRSLNLHAWRLSNHPPRRKASREVARFISRARHPNTMKL